MAGVLSRILQTHSPRRRVGDPPPSPKKPNRLLKFLNPKKMLPHFEARSGAGHHTEEFRTPATLDGVDALSGAQNATDSDAPLFTADAFDNFYNYLHASNENKSLDNFLCSSTQAAISATFNHPNFSGDWTLVPSGSSQLQPGIFADNGNLEDELNFLTEDYKAQAKNRSWVHKGKHPVYPAEYAEAFEPPAAQFEYQGAPYNIWIDNAYNVDYFASTPGSSGTSSPLGPTDAPPSTDTTSGDDLYPPNEIDRLLAGDYGTLPNEDNSHSSVTVKLDLPSPSFDEFNGFDLGNTNASLEEPANPILSGSAGIFGLENFDAVLMFTGINSAFQTHIGGGEVHGPFLEFDPYANVPQNEAEGNWNLDRSLDNIPLHKDGGLFDMNQPAAFSSLPRRLLQPDSNCEIHLEREGDTLDKEAHENASQTLPEHLKTSFPAVSQRLRRSTRHEGKGKEKAVAEDELIDEDVAQFSDSDYIPEVLSIRRPFRRHGRQRRLAAPGEEKAQCSVPGCTEWVTRTDAPHHITYQHPELRPGPKAVMYCPLQPCHIKGPFLAESFSRHYRDVHHGIRPKCPLCGKALGRSEKYYLQRHQESTACVPFGTEVVSKRKSARKSKNGDGPASKKIKRDHD